jgi:hypothetical protein
MIVGDDTRTRVRPGRFGPRRPHAATTLAQPWKGPGTRTAKRRNEGGNAAGIWPACHGPVNAGNDPNAQTTPHGRVPAMIIRMRLRAGAAIPGRLRTRPLWPPITVHGGSVTRPQPGRRGARDFHPPLRRPKALLRAESWSRVTYDHPRSPRKGEGIKAEAEGRSSNPSPHRRAVKTPQHTLGRPSLTRCIQRTP